jgi:hypothetical protein
MQKVLHRETSLASRSPASLCSADATRAGKYCAPVDKRQRADVAGQLKRTGTNQEQARLSVVGPCAPQDSHANNCRMIINTMAH